MTSWTAPDALRRHEDAARLDAARYAVESPWLASLRLRDAEHLRSLRRVTAIKADPASVIPVLAYLVETGRATPRQTEELVEFLMPRHRYALPQGGSHGVKLSPLTEALRCPREMTSPSPEK